MNTKRIFDILFIALVFVLYIIILNIDENIDDANFLSRHIWLTIIIAYYVGRMVSLHNKPNTTGKMESKKTSET